MVKIYNPENKVLSIQFEGEIYSLPAAGVGELPKEVAEYWVGRIHQFLEYVDEDKKPEVKKVPKVKPTEAQG